MKEWKDVIIALINLVTAVLKLFIRSGFAYGCVLLFMDSYNPMEWSTSGKVWLIVLMLMFNNGE